MTRQRTLGTKKEKKGSDSEHLIKDFTTTYSLFKVFFKDVDEVRTNDLLLRILDSNVCLAVLQFCFAKLLNLIILQVELLNEALQVDLEPLVVEDVVDPSQDEACQHLLVVVLVHLLQLSRVFVEGAFFAVADCLPHFLFHFPHELEEEAENHEPVVLPLLELHSIVVKCDFASFALVKVKLGHVRRIEDVLVTARLVSITALCVGQITMYLQAARLEIPDIGVSIDKAGVELVQKVREFFHDELCFDYQHVYGYLGDHVQVGLDGLLEFAGPREKHSQPSHVVEVGANLEALLCREVVLLYPLLDQIVLFQLAHEAGKQLDQAKVPSL